MHQNVSTSTSAPTLARICAFTFPDDSRVSHALAILHLRARPSCPWCISALSPACSLPAQPNLVVRRSRDALHSIRCPISSPCPDTQQTIHGRLRGRFRPTSPWLSRVQRDVRIEIHVALPGGEILSHCWRYCPAGSRR
jgi:hypothetical protein